MTVFHWISLVPFFLQIILVMVILFILYSTTGLFSGFSPLGLFYFFSIVGAILLHLVCYRLYNFFLKVMIITNYRLIDIRNSVFLNRQREVISMSNIQDFRYEQHGILPRVFHYGNLLVLGSSSEVHYLFCYVPRVNKIHHVLGEIHHHAIRNPMMPMIHQEITKAS